MKDKNISIAKKLFIGYLVSIPLLILILFIVKPYQDVAWVFGILLIGWIVSVPFILNGAVQLTLKVRFGYLTPPRFEIENNPTRGWFSLIIGLGFLFYIISILF